MSQPPGILPLQHFFDVLRRHGFPLGIDDYHALVQALMGGFGQESLPDLLRLCELLWLKPGQSQTLFKELFLQTLKQEIDAAPQRFSRSDGLRSPTSGPTPPPPRTPADANRRDKPPKLPDPAPLPNLDAPAAPPPVEPLFSGPSHIQLNIRSSEARHRGLDTGSHAAGLVQVSQQFLFKGGYYPISPRQMELSWRYLQQAGRKEVSDEIDLEGILDQYGKTGFIRPVYLKRTLSDAHLLILIDHGGSMIAFHQLSEALCESAPKSFSDRPQHYYFRNVPFDYLYSDPSHTQAYAIRDLVRYHQHRPVSVLIISDAGAARGYYQKQRVLKTRRALRILQGMTHNLAWLNPVPQARWKGTSAQYIHELLKVPMFEANGAGFMQVIHILRGKPKSLRS